MSRKNDIAAILAACHPGSKSGGANAAVKARPSPYAVIANGKVDIEGGVIEIAARRPGVTREVLANWQRGGSLDAGVLGCWFGKLTSKAGLRPIREGARRASLHSFRHSFAVRRLLAWHEAGLDVQALLPTLSVYLGHVRPIDTYWYLTATPGLLTTAAQRFADYTTPEVRR